jgi:hypothetical protein
MPKLSDLTDRDSVVFKDKVPAKNEPLKLSTLSKGDDAQFLDEPTKLDSAGRGFIQGATLGFSDEIAGGLSGALHAGSKVLPYESPYEDISQAYREGRDSERAKDDAAYKANPWSFRGGEFVGGGIIPFGAGIKGATIAQGVARGAVTGAITGGIAGVGGTKREDAAGMAGAGAFGAATGGVAGGVLGGAGNAIGRSFTKAGRQGLKDEWGAFRRGMSKDVPEGITKEIPIVGPAALRLKAGVTETTESAAARQEFNAMIEREKARIVQKLSSPKDGDEIIHIIPEEQKLLPPGQSPKEAPQITGNDPIEVRKALDDMEPDEFIIRSLMDEGDNEVKAWIAKSAGYHPGQIDSGEYQKILAMGPEARSEARQFTVDKRGIAKDLTPQVADVNVKMKGAIKDRVSELSTEAGGKFDGNIMDLLEKTKTALEDSTSMKTIPQTVHTRLADATDLLAMGKAPSHYGLTKDAPYFDVPNTEQFNRLQKMRETLDAGIDWDAVKTGKRPLDEGEQILARLRGDVDKILKASPAKTQADAVYKLGKEIRDSVFKRTELKGGVDEFKINRLLNNTDEGGRFRQNLKDLEEWANDPQYAQEARDAAMALVNRFQTLYNLADRSRALGSLRYKQGPTSPAVERASSSINKNTIVQDAIRNPASFVNGADEFVKSNAPGLAGKAYKEMSDIEKTALIKTWVRYKKEADDGKFMTPTAMKDIYDSFMKSSNPKGGGSGGMGPGLGVIPPMALMGGSEKEKDDRSDWVPIPQPKQKSIGDQFGDMVDELTLTDRIGNEDGSPSDMPYPSMPGPTGVGKASKKLLAEAKKLASEGEGLQKIFASLSKMKEQGKELTEQQEKLFAMLQKKFKAPIQAVNNDEMYLAMSDPEHRARYMEKVKKQNVPERKQRKQKPKTPQNR